MFIGDQGSKDAKPVRCGMDTIVKINLQHKQIPYFIFVISFFACCIYIRSDVRGRVHLDDNNTCTDISTEKMIKFKTKTWSNFTWLREKPKPITCTW